MTGWRSAGSPSRWATRSISATCSTWCATWRASTTSTASPARPEQLVQPDRVDGHRHRGLAVVATAVDARAGVGHLQRAAWIHHRCLQRRIGQPVLIGRILVAEPVTGAAGSGARGVTALQHAELRIGGQAVAAGVVEVPLLGEAREAV